MYEEEIAAIAELQAELDFYELTSPRATQVRSEVFALMRRNEKILDLYLDSFPPSR